MHYVVINLKCNDFALNFAMALQDFAGKKLKKTTLSAWYACGRGCKTLWWTVNDVDECLGFPCI